MRLRATLLLIPLGALDLAGSASALERAPASEPVKSCPRHGPGFVLAPGTTTCIRIGGRVTSEYGVSAKRIDRDRIAGFGSSAAVSIDARTDTAYGPVRSYVRIKGGQGPGPRN